MGGFKADGVVDMAVAREAVDVLGGCKFNIRGNRAYLGGAVWYGIESVEMLGKFSVTSRTTCM